MASQKNNSGFTLIEIMIAILILLLALGGLLFGFVNCMFLNERNHNLVTAINDAQFVLEEVRSRPFFDSAGVAGVENFCTNYAATAPALTHLVGEAATCTPTFLAETLIQVVVQIDWTEKQRARNVQLSTCLTNTIDY